MGPKGVEEELAIAFSAGDGRVGRVDVGAADLLDTGANAVNSELMGGGIAHDAAFADALAAGFELGLDEDDGFDSWGGRLENCLHDRREHEGRRNEGDVDGEEGDAGGQVAGVEKAGVGALHEGDAGIVAEGLGDLAVAGVDGEDAGSAVLEHAVGESAGGGADVEAETVAEVDAPMGESGFKLESAAADVTEVGAEEADGSIGGDGGARLVLLLLADENAAGQDESLGALASGDEAALHQQLVETDFHGLIFMAGFCMGNLVRRAGRIPDCVAGWARFSDYAPARRYLS
jgi:hypothetical protein